MNLASLIAQLRTGGQPQAAPGYNLGAPTGGPQLATGGPSYGSPGGGYQGPQGPGMQASGGPPQIPQGGFPQGGSPGRYGAMAPPMPTSAPQQPANGGGLQAPPRPPGQPGPGNNGKPWDQRRTGQGFQPGSAAARQWRAQNPGQNPNRPAQPPAQPEAPIWTGPAPDPGVPAGLPPSGPQFTGGPQPQIDPRIAALLASMGMGGGQGPTWGGAPTPDPSKWWMPYYPQSTPPPPPQQPPPRTVPLRR